MVRLRQARLSLPGHPRVAPAPRRRGAGLSARMPSCDAIEGRRRAFRVGKVGGNSRTERYATGGLLRGFWRHPIPRRRHGRSYTAGTIHAVGSPPVPYMTTRTPPRGRLDTEAPTAKPAPPAARHRLPPLFGEPLLDPADGDIGAERGAGFGFGYGAIRSPPKQPTPSPSSCPMLGRVGLSHRRTPSTWAA